LAKLIYADGALISFERIYDFVAETDPAMAFNVVDTIADALDILKRHPLIGRPVEGGRNELPISRGKTGYVALYRYNELLDTVFVLIIRHQREAGYSD
jgi:plasmid stabilization system protein ParE